MQLAYVRDLAEAAAGERVHDVVLTVPPYYTQFERDAVVDAIEIAGLRTLALVNDGAAVAVNYAMTRAFPAPEFHVVFDAGASALRATVVEFAPVPDPKASSKSGAGRDATQITVHGVGFDRHTGGAELDRRMRDLMLADFQRRHKRDISGDRRAMAKLWKEAGRVKAILSANSEAQATVRYRAAPARAHAADRPPRRSRASRTTSTTRPSSRAPSSRRRARTSRRATRSPSGRRSSSPG